MKLNGLQLGIMGHSMRQYGCEVTCIADALGLLQLVIDDEMEEFWGGMGLPEDEEYPIDHAAAVKLTDAFHDLYKVLNEADIEDAKKLVGQIQWAEGEMGLKYDAKVFKPVTYESIVDDEEPDLPEGSGGSNDSD